MCEQNSWEVLLCLPHLVRCIGQDLRCLLSQCVLSPSTCPPLTSTQTFLPVPNPVLGGVTTFLFATVAVSGLRVLSYTSFTRRDRFVLAAALCFGFGDLLVPDIFTHLFESSRVARAVAAHTGLQGLLDSVEIILETPCESFPRYPSMAGFSC